MDGGMCTLDHRSHHRTFRGTHRGRYELPPLTARNPGKWGLAVVQAIKLKGEFTLSAHISWTVRHARQRRVSSFSASWEALDWSPFAMLPLATSASKCRE